jgi:hypothetical protein
MAVGTEGLLPQQPTYDVAADEWIASILHRELDGDRDRDRGRTPPRIKTRKMRGGSAPPLKAGIHISGARAGRTDRRG